MSSSSKERFDCTGWRMRRSRVLKINLGIFWSKHLPDQDVVNALVSEIDHQSLHLADSPSVTQFVSPRTYPSNDSSRQLALGILCMNINPFNMFKFGAK